MVKTNIAPPGSYDLHNTLVAQGVDNLAQLQLDRCFDYVKINFKSRSHKATITTAITHVSSCSPTPTHNTQLTPNILSGHKVSYKFY